MQAGLAVPTRYLPACYKSVAEDKGSQQKYGLEVPQMKKNT
jgi:hypothetical protein